MAFGESIEDHLNQDFVTSIGVITTPNLIWNATIPSPVSLFTGDIIGDVVLDTQIVNIAREYMESWKGTPRQRLRKDLLQKTYMLTLNVYNFNKDTMALFTGAGTTGTNYVVDTFTATAYGTYGTSENSCGNTFYAIHMQSKRVDCAPFHLLWYKTAVNTASVDIQVAGDYAQLTAEFTMFPHESFTSSDNDLLRNTGTYWFEPAPVTPSSSTSS